LAIWPGWMTYSGRFKWCGHSSATDRAQNRESSPTKDRRSTAVLCNQPQVGPCSPKENVQTYMQLEQVFTKHVLHVTKTPNKDSIRLLILFCK